MLRRTQEILAAVCFFAFLLVSTTAAAAFIVTSIGGTNDPASIQTTVDQFRAVLGNPNNGNAPGPLLTGRREINWDGGGVTTTVSGTPFAGFQVIRGALFVTPGSGFVQAPPSGLETTFGNFTYDEIFDTFSPFRLFTPIGSNITDVFFSIPGSPSELATVTGFGAIFTDVDLPTSTTLQFFDLNNNLLFAQNVSPGIVADGSLSFLGAIANAGEEIFRVRITSGNTALGPNDGAGIDVVAMDDFLFAEPLRVPEPSIVALLGIGALALFAVTRRRRS